MLPKIVLFNLKFDTWDTCFLISVVTVLWLVLFFREKDFVLSKAQTFWAAALFIFFGAFGANALNIFSNLAKHHGQSIEQVFRTSGTAYLGAPMLGFLALWVFCMASGVSFLICADYAVPFLMLERIIGRIGCLGHGCCYGVASSLPWAYPFAGTMYRHPTQAYELIYAAAIFLSSRYLYKRLFEKAHGVTFFYVIFTYSFFRFFNESLRAEGPFAWGAVKFSHIGLFIFMVISSVSMFIVIKNSSIKQEMLNSLKGALARLFTWLMFVGFIVLFIFSIIPKHA
ncbi:MAG: prolipoprotein diacylglyceryl transferase [Candidatus Omnitrophica bacterium]|nr:prolipoprotein diacylglyceryl transferase [Candidatus Omnitrophota bacterium]